MQGWMERRVLDYYANVLTDRCYLGYEFKHGGKGLDMVIGILIWPNYIATADVATLRSVSMYILLYILLFLFLNPIPVFLSSYYPCSLILYIPVHSYYPYFLILNIPMFFLLSYYPCSLILNIPVFPLSSYYPCSLILNIFLSSYIPIIHVP